MFRAMVVFTFILSGLNHFLLPRGRISRTLIVSMLCGFVYTEAYLAVTFDPTMWFYVSLNLWGLYNFWRTRVKDGGVADITIVVDQEDIDELLYPYH